MRVRVRIGTLLEVYTLDGRLVGSATAWYGIGIPAPYTKELITLLCGFEGELPLEDVLNALEHSGKHKPHRGRGRYMLIDKLKALAGRTPA